MPMNSGTPDLDSSAHSCIRLWKTAAPSGVRGTLFCVMKEPMP
jgi:hypothetical protein